MSEQYQKIGAIAEIQSGFAYPSDSYQDSGIPIVRMSDLKKGSLKFEYTKYVSESWLTSTSSFSLNSFDFLLGMSGSLENHAIVKPENLPALLNQRVARLKLKSQKASYKYLTYWLSSEYYYRYADIQGEGAAQKNISARQIESFEIRLPKVTEQQKIAAILTSIDTAIEKTEALIEKYRQIKAGLMNDLFTRGVLPNGQLRPPRTQAPELYQQTEIGWIPKDWDAEPLVSLLSSSPKNGYSPREVDTWEGIHVLGLSCLTKNGFEAKQLKNAPFRSAMASGAILRDGDFLMSRANTPELVGLCGIYSDIGELAIYPDLIMRLNIVEKVNKYFLEFLLLWAQTRRRITALAVGTSNSMAKLSAVSLKKLEIPLPNEQEQLRIIETLKPTDNHIKGLTRDCEKLRSIKLGLMRDLLTGKVPVKVDSPIAGAVGG